MNKNFDQIENFNLIENGKIKTKWEGRFFSKKNLRTQVDRVLNSESNGGIGVSLAPLSGKL